MTATASRQGTARRLAAAGAATALAGLGLLAGPTPPAAAAEPCVGVVVDARLLGGGVSTGCAKGDPDSGLEALTMAGYSYAFVPRQPGLVCQVNQAPECSATSTDTYWSYWYRAKGSSTWVYASQGAASHDPAPGSTEAWVWQDGGRRQPPAIAQRTICPQSAPAAPAPTPTKSSSPSPDRTRSATRSPSPKQSSAATTSTAPSGRTSGKRSGSASTSAAPTSTTAPPSTGGPSSSPPSAPSTTPAGDATEDGGGAVPWGGLLVGAGLIAVLGGSALARTQRTGSTGGRP